MQYGPVMAAAMNKGVQTPTKEWLAGRARWVVFPRLHNVQYEPVMVSTAMNKGVQTPTKEWLTAELAGLFSRACTMCSTNQ